MGRSERNHALPALERPWLYCISDGSGWEGLERLVAIAQQSVDFIQIRERQLRGRELLSYCRKLRDAVPASGPKLLVNARLDVALAAGLDGLHCPAMGLPPARLRAMVPEAFLIGKSCHSVAEVEAADGADFCVFGPVFATPSKSAFGPPLGLQALHAAARLATPVLALGGVNADNATACLQQGAAGIAGIRVFYEGNQVHPLRVLLQRGSP